MDPKPGWQTSEFWLALIAQAMPLAVLFKLLPEADVETVQGSLVEMVKSAAAFVGAAVAAWSYIKGRATVKASSKAMRMLLIACLVCCAGSSYAADINLITYGGKHYLVESGSSGPTLKPVTVQIMSLDGVNPIPPGPGPVIPPAVSLTELVKQEAAAITPYEKKDVHRRSMAEAIKFLSPFLGGVSVDQSRATVRAACDGACGADSHKWAVFWASVDARINAGPLTPAAYQAALGEIAAGLSVDLPAAAIDDPNHGLPPEVWQMLLQILLKILEQLFNK